MASPFKPVDSERAPFSFSNLEKEEAPPFWAIDEFGPALPSLFSFLKASPYLTFILVAFPEEDTSLLISFEPCAS